MKEWTMRCLGCQGWINIEDVTNDTHFEYPRCGGTSRAWLYTANTRGWQRVLLAEEKYRAIEQAVWRRIVRAAGMRIGAQS